VANYEGTNVEISKSSVSDQLNMVNLTSYSCERAGKFHNTLLRLLHRRGAPHRRGCKEPSSDEPSQYCLRRQVSQKPRPSRKLTYTTQAIDRTTIRRPYSQERYRIMAVQDRRHGWQSYGPGRIPERDEDLLPTGDLVDGSYKGTPFRRRRWGPFTDSSYR
jgi:hypothetical protein